MAWLTSLFIPQLSLGRQNQVTAHLITAKEHMCLVSQSEWSLADCQQKLSFENMD